MIKVITNSRGSGDWIIIVDGQGRVLHEGSSISPYEIALIFQDLNLHVDIVDITDEELEEGKY